MDYEEMKLECLRLAVEAGHKGAEAIDMARKFYDHCRGRGDGDPLIPGGLTPRARVVGRDTDFEKPFKDYLTKDE